MKTIIKKRTNPYLAVPSAAFLNFCLVWCLNGLSAAVPEPPPGREDGQVSTVCESGEPWWMSDKEYAADPAPSSFELKKSDELALMNRTSIDIDLNDYRRDGLYFSLPDSGPAVLIVHTHGTEAYSMSDGDVYEPCDVDRTLDLSHSVVRVGDEIARILEENGIGVVHSCEIHDNPVFSGAYNRSLKDIMKNVDRYPGICVVLDVHRDAGGTASQKYRTAREVGGQTAAAIEIVVGTDLGGLKHDEWDKNLSFAVSLYEVLEGTYPGLMRPICLREARFNQHVTSGSILIEIGANGDTLEEALRSARMFAQVLAKLLKS